MAGGSVITEPVMPEPGSPVDMDALREAVEFLRPALHADGGDLILMDVDREGVVAVELLGACGTCPLSVVTMTAGIEAPVQAEGAGCDRSGSPNPDRSATRLRLSHPAGPGRVPSGQVSWLTRMPSMRATRSDSS